MFRVFFIWPFVCVFFWVDWCCYCSAYWHRIKPLASMVSNIVITCRWILYLFIYWRSLFCLVNICCEVSMMEVSFFLFGIGCHWLSMCIYAYIEWRDCLLDPIQVPGIYFWCAGVVIFLSIVVVSPAVFCSNSRAILASLAVPLLFLMLLIRSCVYVYPWVEVDGWWDNSHISRKTLIMVEVKFMLSPIFGMHALYFFCVYLSQFLLVE